MADDKAPSHDPKKDAYFVITVVIILVVLWFASGGPGRADLRGILLAPPQPLGSGNSYNPNQPQQQPTFDQGSVPPPQQLSQ